jgi:hypothetical protein
MLVTFPAFRMYELIPGGLAFALLRGSVNELSQV